MKVIGSQIVGREGEGKEELNKCIFDG